VSRLGVRSRISVTSFPYQSLREPLEWGSGEPLRLCYGGYDALCECGCSGLEQTPSTNEVVNTGKFYLDVVTASIQFLGCIVCFIG
jgi:hypothetical protein